MAHTPLKITIPEVQDEVRYAWANSYSPAAIGRALDSIADEPAAYKISHLISRLFFRGIYFPQKGTWSWLKLLVQNRRRDLPRGEGLLHQVARTTRAHDQSGFQRRRRP